MTWVWGFHNNFALSRGRAGRIALLCAFCLLSACASERDAADQRSGGDGEASPVPISDGACPILDESSVARVMGDAYEQEEGFDGYSGGESIQICNFVSPDGAVIGVRAKRRSDQVLVQGGSPESAGDLTCSQIFGNLVGSAIPVEQLSLDEGAPPFDEAGYLVMDGQPIGIFACTATSAIQVASLELDERFLELLREVIEPTWV